MSASAGSVATVVRSGEGGSPPSTKTTYVPSKSSFGIIMSVLGAGGIIAAVAAQTFAIDHGSNQKPIDANNITTVWSIVIGVLLLVVGAVLWFTSQSVGGEYRYNMLYGIAFSSYIVATIALYMSTIQVIVRESTN